MRAACASARVFVEAVGHGQRLAVIGDGDVLRARGRPRPAPSPRGCRARRSRSCACAGRRAGRRPSISVGQRARRGRVDLAAVLAQLRRHPRQAERLRRSPSSVSPAMRAWSSASNSPYSFSCQPRSSARSRRTMLWAFEPVKYCRRRRAARRRRCAGRPGSRRASARWPWCSPSAEHALDEREGGEGLEQSAGRRRRARMSRSPQVSAPRRTLPTVTISRPGGCARSYATSASDRSVASRQQVAAGELLPLLDRLQDQLLLLGAHALEAADAARFAPPPRGRRGS